MIESGMNKEYLSWEEAYIGLCRLFALRSKDPIDKVGCCVVNNNHKLLALGYNGLPIGCNDNDFPWTDEGNLYDTKKAYSIPAIVNALLIAKYDLTNCSIYTTLFPCYDSTIAIIQRGIKQIYYVSDQYAHLNEYKASKRMFDASGVTYKQVDDIEITAKTKTKTLVRQYL